jgi:hypothetical protein
MASVYQDKTFGVMSRCITQFSNYFIQCFIALHSGQFVIHWTQREMWCGRRFWTASTFHLEHVYNLFRYGDRFIGLSCRPINGTQSVYSRKEPEKQSIMWDVLILASFVLQAGTPQSGHSSLCLTKISKKAKKCYIYTIYKSSFAASKIWGLPKNAVFTHS